MFAVFPFAYNCHCPPYFKLFKCPNNLQEWKRNDICSVSNHKLFVKMFGFLVSKTVAVPKTVTSLQFFLFCFFAENMLMGFFALSQAQFVVFKRDILIKYDMGFLSKVKLSPPSVIIFADIDIDFYRFHFGICYYMSGYK